MLSLLRAERAVLSSVHEASNYKCSEQLRVQRSDTPSPENEVNNAIISFEESVEPVLSPVCEERVEASVVVLFSESSSNSFFFSLT